MAGEPNSPVRELWDSKTRRAFKEVDGHRRTADLFGQMVPVEMPEGQRYKVYPARNERFMRVVRKVARGLSYSHGLLTPVADERVWADVLRFAIPEEFLAAMRYDHRDAEICEYHYQEIHEFDIHSAWIITFIERRTFIALISESDSGWDSAA